MALKTHSSSHKLSCPALILSEDHSDLIALVLTMTLAACLVSRAAHESIEALTYDAFMQIGTFIYVLRDLEAGGTHRGSARGGSRELLGDWRKCRRAQAEGQTSAGWC